MAACSIGTVLFLAIYMTGILGDQVDFGVVTILSLVPLAVAVIALFTITDQKEKVVRQVKLNFASMMSFLLLVDLVLLIG
jgi:heme/copper-type cytochrome/quinol oxidase subunit 4